MLYFTNLFPSILSVVKFVNREKYNFRNVKFDRSSLLHEQSKIREKKTKVRFVKMDPEKVIPFIQSYFSRVGFWETY